MRDVGPGTHAARVDCYQGPDAATFQCQLLLSCTAAAGPGPRVLLARRASSLLRGARAGCGTGATRTRTQSVQRRDAGDAEGVPTADRELSLWAPIARAARSATRLECEDPIVGDHCRRSTVAAGSRGRRDHRTGTRGWRTSRPLP